MNQHLKSSKRLWRNALRLVNLMTSTWQLVPK